MSEFSEHTEYDEGQRDEHKLPARLSVPEHIQTAMLDIAWGDGTPEKCAMVQAWHTGQTAVTEVAELAVPQTVAGRRAIDNAAWDNILPQAK